MDLDIAVVGMAVMGQNLALNFADHGFNVGVYNRSYEKTKEFTEKNFENTLITGFQELSDLIDNLKKPRKILFMIKAGPIVDSFIENIIDLLEPGDIIIDGGNSHYNDTIRRSSYLKERDILFLGAGVSGGEEGARHGPSIMVGGEKSAWNLVKPMFQAIAAKTENNEVCGNWLGNDGAGHFVKMVHNGIEYGDMQLISEIYSLIRVAYGLLPNEIALIFSEWNEGILSSYLIEITASILAQNDERTGKPMVDIILDKAEQKGTGRWTAQSALELGVPIPLITTSVFQRSISSDLNSRKKGNQIFVKNNTSKLLEINEDSKLMLEQSLFFAKLISYNQGFHLIKTASKEYDWDLDLGEIALLWRAGCIIRSSFLETIKQSYIEYPQTEHLIFSNQFKKSVEDGLKHIRNAVKIAIEFEIPVPGLMSALSYFESIRSKYLSTSLIQAQRDFFGAHTFLRNDEETGKSYHREWVS